jgi:hypothetical protein
MPQLPKRTFRASQTAIAILSSAMLVLPAAAELIYVDVDAQGASDGTSWVDAFSDLRAALSAAEPGDQLWVAEGTYRPTGPSGDRSLSFELRSDVAIYGGFSGTESQLDERDPTLHVTVLSGDLSSNDGPNFANYGENSFHVVTADGVSATATLDGFAVSGGSAPDSGGGLHSLNSSPTFRNCAFVQNRTEDGTSATMGNAGSGGGLYCQGGSPSFEHCRFEENRAGRGGTVFGEQNIGGHGGGLALLVSTTSLIDCVIANNHAGSGGIAGSPSTGGSGGGMYVSGSLIVLDGCLFTGNVSGSGGLGVANRGNSGDGGAVFGSATTFRIEHCEFSGNRAAGNGGPSTAGRCGNGGAICAPGGALMIKECYFAENAAGDATDSSGSDGLPGGDGGAIFVQATFVVENTQFLANRAGNAAPSSPDHERGGNGGAIYSMSNASCRFTNCLLAGNRSGDGTNNFQDTAGGNGGSGAAIYRVGANLAIGNCTFTQNELGSPGMGRLVFGTPGTGGAIASSAGAAYTFDNSISFGNDDPDLSGPATVRYSDIEGGVSGPGNINADPRFIDPAGPDNNPDTVQDNDYRLAAPSPCIDAGDNAAVPSGVTLDLDGTPRFIDDCGTPDTGAGVGAIVDIGAYEFASATPPPADLDHDYDVDLADLAQLLSRFGMESPTHSDGDIDEDGDVDLGDLAVLLSRFGLPCG